MWKRKKESVTAPQQLLTASVSSLVYHASLWVESVAYSPTKSEITSLYSHEISHFLNLTEKTCQQSHTRLSHTGHAPLRHSLLVSEVRHSLVIIRNLLRRVPAEVWSAWSANSHAELVPLMAIQGGSRNNGSSFFNITDMLLWQVIRNGAYYRQRLRKEAHIYVYFRSLRHMMRGGEAAHSPTLPQWSLLSRMLAWQQWPKDDWAAWNYSAERLLSK